MSADIEQLYQEIGQESLAIATDLNGKLLVYAEVEDRVVAVSLFYEKGAERTVTFEFCSGELVGLIYSFWEKWKLQPGNVEWRAMAYFVQQGGHFDIDFTYPDQIAPDEELPARRPRIIAKYFGDVKVDYPESKGKPFI